MAGDVPVIAAALDDMAMDGLLTVLDAMRPQLGSGVIVLGGAAKGKAAFVAYVSSDWVERGLHAGQLIGQVARIAGGGGGGQPQKAQAGGKKPEKVPEAIAQVPALILAASGS